MSWRRGLRRWRRRFRYQRLWPRYWAEFWLDILYIVRRYGLVSGISRLHDGERPRCTCWFCHRVDVGRLPHEPVPKPQTSIDPLGRTIILPISHAFRVQVDGPISTLTCDHYPINLTAAKVEILFDGPRPHDWPENKHYAIRQRICAGTEAEIVDPANGKIQFRMPSDPGIYLLQHIVTFPSGNRQRITWARTVFEDS